VFLEVVMFVLSYYRQRTEHAVLQYRDKKLEWLPQSFRDATPTLRKFQRRPKTSLFRLPMTAHCLGC